MHNYYYTVKEGILSHETVVNLCAVSLKKYRECEGDTGKNYVFQCMHFLGQIPGVGMTNSDEKT